MFCAIRMLLELPSRPAQIISTIPTRPEAAGTSNFKGFVQQKSKSATCNGGRHIGKCDENHICFLISLSSVVSIQETHEALCSRSNWNIKFQASQSHLDLILLWNAIKRPPRGTFQPKSYTVEIWFTLLLQIMKCHWLSSSKKIQLGWQRTRWFQQNLKNPRHDSAFYPRGLPIDQGPIIRPSNGLFQKIYSAAATTDKWSIWISGGYQPQFTCVYIAAQGCQQSNIATHSEAVAGTLGASLAIAQVTDLPAVKMTV